jgi:hypothetical protein
MIEVSQEYKNAYNRLIKEVPVPFRYEEAIKKMILENLKSNGEQYVLRNIRRACDEYMKKSAGDNL